MGSTAGDSWWLRLHPVSRPRLVAGFLLALVGPGAVAAILSAAQVPGLPIQTLVMLVVVVATALVGGLLPAVVSALASGTLLNVVFVEPVGTLRIADPQQAVAIGLFLVIGVAVALVVDLAARRTERANRAQAEADALGALAQRLVTSGDDLTSVLEEAGRRFELAGAAVWRTDEDGFVLESSWGDPTAPAVTPDRVVTPVDAHTVLVLGGHTLPSDAASLVAAYAGHIRVLRDRGLAARQALAAAELAQGVRTRTALLGAVSHDLRTPLAAIKAAAGSLRSTEVSWSEEDRAELLGTIENGADQMAQLVANLLDMTRLQTEAVSPLVEDIDLEDVVHAAVRPLAGHERLAFDLSADAGAVRADSGLLERVVANLVENALRYAPHGPIQVRARPVAGSDGQVGVELAVVDSGPGVPAERRADLFQPFLRLGDAPHGSGLGLGLAVAHGLTEAMGGTVRAGETPGGGLTVTVWLPAAGEG